MLGYGDDGVGPLGDRRLQPCPPWIQVMVMEHDREASARQGPSQQQRRPGVADRMSAEQIDAPRAQQPDRVRGEDQRRRHPVQATPMSEHVHLPARRWVLEAVVGRHPEHQIDAMGRQTLKQHPLIHLSADVGAGSEGVVVGPAGGEAWCDHRVCCSIAWLATGARTCAPQAGRDRARRLPVLEGVEIRLRGADSCRQHIRRIPLTCSSGCTAAVVHVHTAEA